VRGNSAHQVEHGADLQAIWWVTGALQWVQVVEGEAWGVPGGAAGDCGASSSIHLKKLQPRAPELAQVQNALRIQPKCRAQGINLKTHTDICPCITRRCRSVV
jgi:hypothetical protein